MIILVRIFLLESFIWILSFSAKPEVRFKRWLQVYSAGLLLSTSIVWSDHNPVELNYPFVTDKPQNSAWSIDVDIAGNRYVTGRFFGDVDFDPGPGTDFKGPSGGIFVTRWNADGSYEWTQTFVDSTQNPMPTDIDVYDGVVYVCGRFQSLTAGIGGVGSVRSVSQLEDNPDVPSRDVMIIALHADTGAPLLGFGPDFDGDGTGDGVQTFGGRGGDNAISILAEGQTIFCVGNSGSSFKIGFGGNLNLDITQQRAAFIIAINGTSGAPVGVFDGDGIVLYNHQGQESVAKDLVVVDNVAWVCGVAGSPKRNARWWIKAWDSVDGVLVGPENVIDEWTVDYSEAMKIIHHNGFLYVAGEYENATTEDDVELGLPGTGGDDIFVWAYDLNVQNPLIGFGLDLDLIGDGNGLQTFGGSGDEMFSDMVAIGDNIYLFGTYWSTDAGIGGPGNFGVFPPEPGDNLGTSAFLVSLDRLLGHPNNGFSGDGFEQLFGPGFDQGFALGVDGNDLIVGGVGFVNGESGGLLFNLPTEPIQNAPLSLDLLEDIALEFPGTAVTLQISRNPEASTLPLDITLDLTGTALFGDDFILDPPTVHLDFFQETIQVSLAPVGDSIAEGPETILIDIIPGGGFTNGSPEPVTVMIADRPADQWLWENFYAPGTPDIPAELVLDDADADGDGFANLLEFAMASDPILDGSFPGFEMFSFEDENSGLKHIAVRHFENADLTDVELILETSTDMLNWFENTAGLEDRFIESSRIDAGETLQIETVHAEPLDGDAAYFIRLKARRKE